MLADKGKCTVILNRADDRKKISTQLEWQQHPWDPEARPNKGLQKHCQTPHQHLGHTPHHIQNSTDFTYKLQKLKLATDETMISHWCHIAFQMYTYPEKWKPSLFVFFFSFLPIIVQYESFLLYYYFETIERHFSPILSGTSSSQKKQHTACQHFLGKTD